MLHLHNLLSATEPLWNLEYVLINCWGGWFNTAFIEHFSYWCVVNWLKVDMKIMLSILLVLTWCVMSMGLTMEQLCPGHSQQANPSPWSLQSPSGFIVYRQIINQLPNNSFIFAPEAEVPVFSVRFKWTLPSISNRLSIAEKDARTFLLKFFSI